MSGSPFTHPIEGVCLFCDDEKTVSVIASVTISSFVQGERVVGVCDLCSYALRHVWQRAQGERIAALSPHLVRTYLLVPRLPKGRETVDLSAYEFLVDGKGGLPYVEFSTVSGSRDPFDALFRQHGLLAWPVTTRPCYLGYSGSADFSEVLLVWAWGKSLTPVRGMKVTVPNRFVSFATLLGRPTPDAGFHLGVKAAFEALLWRHEMAPDANPLCVVLREPAMRYLRFKSAEGKDGAQISTPDDDMDDASMIGLCHEAMTSEEKSVARLLDENARTSEKRREKISTKEEVGEAPEPETTAKIAEEQLPLAGVLEVEEGEVGDDGEEKKEIAPGFARPSTSLDR